MFIVADLVSLNEIDPSLQELYETKSVTPRTPPPPPPTTTTLKTTTPTGADNEEDDYAGVMIPMCPPFFAGDTIIPEASSTMRALSYAVVLASFLHRT